MLYEQTWEAAKTVHIELFMKHAPYELSGGQKQRVSMAGVLVDKVKILLFDEPLANLDPATGKSAIELIDDIKNKTDTTVLIIEHRLEDVLWKNVDRIILMDNGMIVFKGTPSELLCRDLLKQYGIREPLYLTAMKYAGVDVGKVEHIDNISRLILKEEDRAKLLEWYLRLEKKSAEREQEKILEVQGLTFAYSAETPTVLNNVSFVIKKGEMLAIVGENGAVSIFHGRDFFGCCAARLASGVITYEEVGPAYDTALIKRFELREEAVFADRIEGIFEICDPNFGNLWTNINLKTFLDFGFGIGDKVRTIIIHDGKTVFDEVLPYYDTFGKAPDHSVMIYNNEVNKMALAQVVDNLEVNYGLGFGPGYRVIFSHE